MLKRKVSKDIDYRLVRVVRNPKLLTPLERQVIRMLVNLNTIPIARLAAILGTRQCTVEKVLQRLGAKCNSSERHDMFLKKDPSTTRNLKTTSKVMEMLVSKEI